MPLAIVLVALAAAAYTLLQLVLDLTQDAREPPVAERSIPFVSPIVGMIKHKTFYYNHIRSQGNHLPIYTLRLPGARSYIINSTDLISAVERQWRTISFTPIMARAGQATLGMSQAGAEILRKDITSESNSVAGLVPILARTMAPGPALNSMVSRAIKVMSQSVDNLIEEKGTCSKIKLYEWTRHNMLMATTDAVFGPKNPYHDPAVESAWRTFEPAYLTISLSPFKTLTARTAFKARESLASTFVSYLENGGPDNASEFIRAAHMHNVSHGFSINDLARFEVGHTHAITGSTGPTTWWLLWHLYSDPMVLRDVREELEDLAESSLATLKKKTLNLSQLSTRAPVLHSTLKEVLRLRTMATAVRLCLEDQLLQDKYLLKKGALVMTPQPLHHLDTSAWGEDANIFNHRRFISEKCGTRSENRSNETKGYNKAAFRAFGSGHFLCPGRHFSISEILAFGAIMVLRFDLKPTAGGEWVEPTWKNTPMVSSLHIPDEDIEVEVRERDDGNGTQWNFIGG